MNNPGFALTVEQQTVFNRLDVAEQGAITNKIDSINLIRTITPAQIEDDVRYSYILPNELNQNIQLPPHFNNTVETAKLQLIGEDTVDINNILNGDPPVLRRVVGGGDRGVLIDRVLRLLNELVVGGKRRKTSNKKVSARRSCSSKCKDRKARKARKARTTRRKY